MSESTPVAVPVPKTKMFKVVGVGIPRSFNGQSFSGFWSGGYRWEAEETEHLLTEVQYQQMLHDIKNAMPLRLVSANEVVEGPVEAPVIEVKTDPSKDGSPTPPVPAASTSTPWGAAK